MSRDENPDQGLATLLQERDSLKIQLRLLKDSEGRDSHLLETQRRLEMLDRRIANHKLAPKVDPRARRAKPQRPRCGTSE